MNKEYLQKFTQYDDNLLWYNEIDDSDERIDMWLESDEHKTFVINDSKKNPFQCRACPECGEFAIKIEKRPDGNAYCKNDHMWSRTCP